MQLTESVHIKAQCLRASMSSLYGTVKMLSQYSGKSVAWVLLVFQSKYAVDSLIISGDYITALNAEKMNWIMIGEHIESHY